MLKKLVFFFVLLLGTLQAQPSIKELIVETPECHLFCRILGEGKPLVVLHGGPGLSQDYLEPQLYELAKHNLVIFYDQRGCGASTGEINEESITLQNYVEDLENVRKAFGFEKISLLGHSWGGFLAMNYAIAHPEAIEKLILSNSVPATFPDFLLFVAEWTRRLNPYMLEMAEIHQSPGYAKGDPEVMEHLYRIIFRTYCYNPESADDLNLRLSPKAAINGSKIHEIFAETVFMHPFDLTEGLKELTCPTLVIHGDTDSIPLLTAQHIHESIPHSEFVLIKNCGHFPYVEKPCCYFKHLNKFLK